MEIKPSVVVEPPDDDGLRKVVIDGKSKGKLWSHHELQKVLHRAGMAPEYEIEWRGGDGTVWPHTPGDGALPAPSWQSDSWRLQACAPG